MILKSAYFEMCSGCKRHGRIVFPDGTKSIELCSIATARETVLAARTDGKITDAEEKIIWQQVIAADLSLEENVGDLIVEITEHLKKAASEFNDAELIH